jgi:hypothetical protein
MRTKTITRNLYSFDELSPSAQAAALDNCRLFNIGDGWYDFVYEDAANVGLKITGFDLDRNRHATGDFELSAVEVAANIIRDHGEVCETFKTAQNFLEEHSVKFEEYTIAEASDQVTNEGIYAIEDELTVLEYEFKDSLLEDYSILLQKEYEHLYEDEAVQSTIEANEYEFTEDGNRA